jgi:hypothetical protein
MTTMRSALDWSIKAVTIAILALGDANNCGQYQSIAFAAVAKVFTASPVITALLDLGEDRKP